MFNPQRGCQHPQFTDEPAEAQLRLQLHKPLSASSAPASAALLAITRAGTQNLACSSSHSPPLLLVASRQSSGDSVGCGCVGVCVWRGRRKPWALQGHPGPFLFILFTRPGPGVPQQEAQSRAQAAPDAGGKAAARQPGGRAHYCPRQLTVGAPGPHLGVEQDRALGMMVKQLGLWDQTEVVPLQAELVAVCVTFA